MKLVFGEVIAKVKPDKAEVRASFELFSRISSFIREEYGLSAKLMGSVAKDTFLSGDKDLDIFVFFPVSFSRNELEKKALEIGKAVFEEFGCRDYTVSYAEHPYTKGVIEGYEVEVVPAYSIKSTKNLKSAVDRTPFHTEYVLANLENHDEVRIFKRFLKGIGCYGSDLKTEGFSGYLCEILIIHYNTFKKVISEAQNWKEQQIIDVESLYSKTNYKKVRRMFKDQPLIVVDPVDKKRNVAAVLSVEKLAQFMIHARKFEQKPQQKYFFPRKRQIDTRQVVKSSDESGIKIYAVLFERPDVIEDVLYPQLRKLASNFESYLKRHDFSVVDSWVFADGECGIGFKVMNTKVMNHKIVKGPSVFNPLKHQDGFIKTHKKVWLEDDRYLAEVKRECCLIDEGIRMFFGGSLKALADKGVPMNLAKMICKGFRVLAGTHILKIKCDEFWRGAERENIK